jgi:tetratricopeptide (TPR) repeat protein
VTTVRMSLYLDHDVILKALRRAHAAAQKLYREGKPKQAAERMHVMFQSIVALVDQASRIDGLESGDDVSKWLIAFTANDMYATINLTAQEWGPFLNDYAYYLQQAGDHKEARKILQIVVKNLPDRAVAVLNLADSEYALKDFAGARAHYKRYLALVKEQQITRVMPAAIERAR